MESAVVQDIEPGMEHRLRHIKGWRGINNPWMAEGQDTEEYQYINLLANPERYTGYKVSCSPTCCWFRLCAARANWCCDAGLCAYATGHVQ